MNQTLAADCTELMTNKKEITATEKLLDLIRAENSECEAPVTEGPESFESNSQNISGVDENILQNPPDSSPDVALEENQKPVKQENTLQPALQIDAVNQKDVNEVEPEGSSSAKKEESTWTWYNKKNESVLARHISSILHPAKIGVDIQPGAVHFVKTKVTQSNRALEVSESVTFDYDFDAQNKDDKKDADLFNNPAVKGILSQKLSSLSSNAIRKPEIWCSYAFCNPIAIYNITLPKVAPKDIPQAVFWTVKKEVEFDEKSTIFDYKVFQEIEIKGQLKIQVIVTLVPKREATAIQTLFTEIGYQLTGLTFPAAAIQNLLQASPEVPESNPVVYFTIRGHNSFIDLFYKGEMLFSREIKTGVESFVESILDQAAENDILLDETTAKGYIFDLFDGKKIHKDLAIDQEIADSLDLDALPVIERLIRQLLRTFEYCTSNFKIPPVIKLYTAGTSILNANVLNTIQKKLDMQCSVIKPFSQGVFSFDSAPRVRKELNIIPAAGLSISDRFKTNNFLYTYIDKAREKYINRVNKAIALVTIALAIAIGSTFAFQYGQIQEKKMIVHQLEESLEQKYAIDPRTSSSSYMAPAIEKIKQSHETLKESIERYRVLGIIQEISTVLPKGVQLTKFSINFPSLKKEAPQKNSKKNKNHSVLIQGLISAPVSRQDFILLDTLKKLSSLSFSSSPELLSSKKHTSKEDENLSFSIKMGLREILRRRVEK